MGVANSDRLPEAAFFNRLRDRGEAPHSDFFAEELRQLSSVEITILEHNGNYSRDWSSIRVVRSFQPDNIRNSVFRGICFLGRFSSQNAQPHVPELGSGIFYSTLSDCAISDNCLISNIPLLSGYHVERDTAILDCGRVVHRGLTDTWFDAEICPGNETGGREFPLLPEIAMEKAAAASMGDGRGRAVEELRAIRDACFSKMENKSGLIGESSCIAGTSLVLDSHIWPGSSVDNCVELRGSLLISDEDAPSHIKGGAVVRSSVIRPGVVVDSGSIVQLSYLAEAVHVEKQAKISGSYCGPGCGLGEGEVTASLLGPYIAMHHQSLLIAALWPEGRGNVGYGANIGSNHTGRAPDQECLIGEGCFFGLGSSIKYPSDLGCAPHSVIATAVVLPPIRLSFPLSLIVLEEGELCCKPGWLWGASAFTLLRNRDKIARRGGGHAPLFSEKTVIRIRDGLRLLADTAAPSALLLKDEDRALGIQSYREAYRYALLEFAHVFKDKMAVDRLHDPDISEAAGLPQSVFDDPDALKQLFIQEYEALLLRAERSRKRDWIRGNAVLEGLYAEAHSEKEPLLEQLRQELDGLV